MFAFGNKSHTLQWNDVKYLDPTYSDKRLLSFDGAVYIDESYLPYFVETSFSNEKQTLDSVVVKNFTTTDLTTEEQSLLTDQKSLISSSPKVSIAYSTDRKQEKTHIYVLPFVVENGVCRKLISFELEYYFANTLMKLRSSSVPTKADIVHSYAAQSVLKSGKWVKISVPQTGIYKITYEDLVKWGIPNPANAHIFGYGGAMLPESFEESKIDDLPQLSVWKETGSDGVFNAGDFLLFYAQGPVQFKYNVSYKGFDRIVNPYSTAGYYFITSDVGEEKLIPMQPAIQDDGVVEDVYTFLDYQLHEQDLRNIYSSGREWYGEQFDKSNPSRSFSFNFPNVRTDQQAPLIVGAGSTASSTINIAINGTYIDQLSSFTGNKLQSKLFTPSNSSLTVTLTYNQSSSSTVWLNYIVANAYRDLVVTENSLFFRNPNLVSGKARFHIQGSADLLFWNITDPLNITRMYSNIDGSEHSFIDCGNNKSEYVAIKPKGSFDSPTFVGDVLNQNLHALPQVDYVIITHPDFLSQANQLADVHREKQGIQVEVVTAEQVYNEFSSGTPDATAYRWLMKMLYDRAGNDTDQMPKYLLLFGDGTYDNKGVLKANVPYNKLLTYQSKESLAKDCASYVTDDYFAMLDNNEGTSLSTTDNMDIAVGRLPVTTAAQASTVVSKISDYLDNKQKDYWKNRLVFIGDDDDTEKGTDASHIGQADECVKYIEEKYPNFQPKRIFLDAFYQQIGASGETYPQVKELLFKQINTGSLIVNFTGHGSADNIATEQILTKTDIEEMHNTHYPLFYMATCDFSRFDETKMSAGESLLLKSGGGGIATISAARTVYSDRNAKLNQYFYTHIFEKKDGKYLSIGEALRKAKNDYPSNANKLSYSLLGDPALSLPIPEDSVKVSEITSNSTSKEENQYSEMPCVNALSTVTIKGYIQSSAGEKQTIFNGKLKAVVFDKVTKLITLGNNNKKYYPNPPIPPTDKNPNWQNPFKDEADSLARMEGKYLYYDRPNILFSGDVVVKDGEFILQFMVPKDIMYNYGVGRINFYAADETNNLEAQGYFEDFKIGGTKTDFVLENEGPVIDMYMNTPQFRSGHIIDPTSTFFANLYDENGINVTGAGIGHDLTLTLNNDPTFTYNLNDYYETTMGDYRSGSLSYKLPTLDDGEYTLTLRAWDLLNNSSTKSLNFKVSKEAKPELYEFYAMPNPAESHVQFMLVHNQPSSKLDIKIDVFNLSGGLVFTKDLVIYSDGNTTIYDWDLRDAGGRKLMKGLYLYRISVEADGGGVLTYKTNKLIVK